MIKQRSISGLVIVILIAMVSWLFWQDTRFSTENNGNDELALESDSNSHSPIARELLQLDDRSQVEIRLGETQLRVEVVNTLDSITQGLSGRTEIGADGMLFVFSETRMPVFWMKEMQFDVDMVWLADGQIMEVTSEVPAPDPDVPLRQLPRYQPAAPVQMVLEIPAGQAESLGLVPGQELTLLTRE